MGAESFAGEIEGLVKSSGSAASAYTLISVGEAEKGDRLCSGDASKSIRRLGGMTVKVSGDWKLDQKGEKDCFEPTDFSVQKVSSGRDAIVGILSKKDGGYIVAGSDGQIRVLGSVSSGLKKLDGQKVILDLKALNSPASKETVYKVVTYAAHPQ
jgi:hypothetical protein